MSNFGQTDKKIRYCYANAQICVPPKSGSQRPEPLTGGADRVYPKVDAPHWGMLRYEQPCSHLKSRQDILKLDQI